MATSAPSPTPPPSMPAAAETPVSSAPTPGPGATGSPPTASGPGLASSPTKTKRQRQASTLPVRGGKREMKAYAVTEEELENLGMISLGSSASFSLSTFLAAFCLSVWSGSALSNGVKPEVLSFWQGLSIAAAIFCAVSLFLGGFLIWRGASKITRIKDSTVHD